MSDNYSIEIDCPPFTPRPDTHFASLCVKCNVKPDWFNEPTKLFGNWEWTVKPQYVADYKSVQNTVKSFLQELYHRSLIRYASW